MGEIRNRYTQEVIASGEESVSKLAEMCRADLRDANLRGAYLRNADLRDADLRGADLCGAYLSGAYLSGASFRYADLRDANLRGAYLRNADLRNADLRGAYLNWQSHDLIAELLLQAAGDNLEKRKVAGLILVSRDWCWGKFAELVRSDPLGKWAVTVLSEYLIDGVESPLRDLLNESEASDE